MHIFARASILTDTFACIWHKILGIAFNMTWKPSQGQNTAIDTFVKAFKLRYRLDLKRTDLCLTSDLSLKMLRRLISHPCHPNISPLTLPLWTFPVVHNTFCSWLALWKRFFPYDSPQTPLRTLAQLLTKIGATKFKKEFVFLDNYFSELFMNVYIWYWKTFSFGLGHFFRKMRCFSAKIWLLLLFSKDNKSQVKFYRQWKSNFFETF